MPLLSTAYQNFYIPKQRSFYKLIIGVSSKMGYEIDPDFWGNVHGISLTVAWLIFQNIALWALHFKHLPNAVYVHISCMSAASFLMALGPMIELVINGPSIILASIYHQLLGFVLYVILPVILVSGATCKLLKGKPTCNPFTVYLGNKVHSAMGWLYILLMKVVLLTGWYGTNAVTDFLFGLVILISVVSYSSYLYLKFLGKRIEAVSLYKDVVPKGLRIVTSHKDLNVYSGDYFIFANYVYSIDEILAAHPGGWQIIKSARGRQVDRFLYGVDPMEMHDAPRVSHSLRSIELAGPPIAVLQLPLTYSPVQQLNQAKVVSASCHDKLMRVYTIFLALEGTPVFQGYRCLTQIGQYYSLTLNKTRTRLYTAVNFLQPANVKLLKRITNDALWWKSKKLQEIYSYEQENHQVELIDEKLVQQTGQTEFVLPLLIKRYSDGTFTSEFFSLLESDRTAVELQISQPRGLGLSLDSINCSNVLIFAGGTGLYPYSDLIDLLFKDKIVKQNPSLAASIMQSDPLLTTSPFDRFTFSLYISVNELSQLHPITLHQLNQLSSQPRFRAHVRIKALVDEFKQAYSNITVVRDRFEQVITREYGNEPRTMTYICGPVRFTKALVTHFQTLGVPADAYRII